MAYFYMDFATGSDAASGVDWANEVKTFEILLSKMSAGDIGIIRQGSDDTAATARTFTSPGTVQNPCMLIGVKAGTTNTGTSIVTSDLATTLPKISNTGALNALSPQGCLNVVNVHFSASYRIAPASLYKWTYIGCKITYVNRFYTNSGGKSVLINSILEPTAAAAEISLSSAVFEMYGGSVVPTTQPNALVRSGGIFAKFVGVDLSAVTAELAAGGTGVVIDALFTNCKMNATVTLFSAAMASPLGKVTLISSDDSSSVGNTSSIQDYSYQDSYGTIDLETTVVRTGGADDGATGLFAYAMTPLSNGTKESTTSAIKSPWLSVWVPGGASKTLTVYIANSSASTDYNEDEVRWELYTPSASDVAQHDQTFDPADAYLLDSTTPVTDDTGSTWGSGGNNHQKFSATVTPGFEGWAYARVHLAKRQATPDTLYLDPLIEVI